MAAVSASILFVLATLELKVTFERVHAGISATALMTNVFPICIFLHDNTIFSEIRRDRCQFNRVIAEDEATRLAASAAYWENGQTNEIDF